MPNAALSVDTGIKAVLLTCDFSKVSDKPLRHALAIAHHYHAKFYLAHVVCSIGYAIAGPPSLHLATEAATRDMQKLEQGLMANGCLHGLTHEFIVRQGDIWKQLESVIADKQVDLVVVGTHGRGGFKKLILGSVAEEIIREAPCPVIGVGPEVPSRAQLPGNMRHILLATDFVAGSLAALKYAVSFAEENNARLTVLHVVDHRDPPLAPNEGAFHLLLSADLNLVSRPDLLVKSGAPAEVILELAAEKQTDLIVVGAHGTPVGALSTRTLWPTLHRLLCEAQSPVLTVRG